MKFLDKLRKLPEGQRKIILWSAIIIIGILLLAFYIKILELKLKSLNSEEIRGQLKIPEFQERLKELPKIEIPEISEEELKKLEEKIQEAEKEKQE